MYSTQMIDQQKHARALNKYHRRKDLNASTIWIIDIAFVIALIIGLAAATISVLMVNANSPAAAIISSSQIDEKPLHIAQAKPETRSIRHGK